MISQITSGFANPGQQFSPGIFWVAFTNWENVTGISQNSGIITACTLSGGAVFRQFDCKPESSEFQDNPNGNDVNGTINYTQNVNLYLANYSTAVSNKVNLLATQRLMAIVFDRNGQYWLVGDQNTGINLVDSTAGNGKSYSSDPNGYSLSFRCLSTHPAYSISPSLIPSIVSY